MKKKSKKLVKSYCVNKGLQPVAAAVAVGYELVKKTKSQPRYTGVT